jgi:DNA repair protein RecO (recombination protein O)
MPYYKDEFLIINSRFFKEKDLTVITLSKKFGKRDIIIRGVRSIKSRYRGATEPLTLCKGIVHYKPNSDFYTLSSVEVLEIFYDMSDLTKVNDYFFMLGLINHFIPFNLVIKNFYSGTVKFLKIMKEKNNNLIALYYSLWLLKKVGYQPNVDVCSHCREKLHRIFAIDFFSHSIICNKCFPGNKKIYYSEELLIFLKKFYSEDRVKINDLLKEKINEKELRKFLKNYFNILIEYKSHKKILDFL